MPLTPIFIPKSPFLIPFTGYFNVIAYFPPDHKAYLFPYHRLAEKLNHFSTYPAISIRLPNYKHKTGRYINLPLGRHYFFFFTCLLVFTSEIYTGSGFNDKEQQIYSLKKQGWCGHCSAHTRDKAWYHEGPEREDRAQWDVTSFSSAVQPLQLNAGLKRMSHLFQGNVSN